MTKQKFSDAAVEAAMSAYEDEYSRWSSDWSSTDGAYAIFRRKIEGVHSMEHVAEHTESNGCVDRRMDAMRKTAAMRAALEAAAGATREAATQ